jgi:hypothetical protein
MCDMLHHDPSTCLGSGMRRSIFVRIASASFELFLVVLIFVAAETYIEAQSSQTATQDVRRHDLLLEPEWQVSIYGKDHPGHTGFAAASAQLPDFDTRTLFLSQNEEETGARDISDGELPRAPIQVDLTPFVARLGHSDRTSRGSLPEQAEHYHWKGLLLQSLGFIAVENAFRMTTDDTMRYLIADKPYWHDYIASLHQFNMRRWNDGDNFLVNYIGHPMQGGVTSFIEIQNSPRDRNLRIGASRAYWKSRLIAMLWSTLFSTESEIGPLGEAALGNEGGYTYVPGCQFPCPRYVPGVTKYTNNTGWVDFIVTPTVGTLWVLLEDSIDRFVSDPIQNPRPEAYFPKALRGGLNPCRTMANALRFKKPWYRDFQHQDVANQPAVHFVRSDEEEAAMRRIPHFEIFPHFNALSLPVNTSECGPCRRLTSGSGVGFSYRISRWVDFDSDINYQPNASPLPSYRAGGSIFSGTFGFRTGFQTPNYSLKIAVRPGFVSYNRAYFLSPASYTLGFDGAPAYPEAPPAPTDPGRITHFATALTINADYGFTRHFALRATFGNTPVRYKTQYLDRVPGIGTPPYLSFISPNIFATNENWTYQIGPVIRF